MLSLGLNTLAQKITYHLKIENPHRNCFDIQIEYLCNEEKYLDFILPAWRPGSLAITDWSKNVFRVTVQTEKGEKLIVKKIDKQTWRVDCKPGDKVVFSYKVYSYTMGDPYDAHVESDYAFYNGPQVFMFLDKKQSFPIEVEFEYPKDWQFHTALTKKISENKYEASDYDELIDCPSFFGKLNKFSFEVSGIPHYIVLNAGYDYNQNQITTDLSKLVAWFKSLFGELPYDNYTFFLRVDESGRGAIEHRNSNISCIKPNGLLGNLEDPEYYKFFIMTESHEFFHLYNVKRIRPTEYANTDFRKEYYSDLLWFVEGFTDYYTDRPLSNAGIISSSKVLNRYIDYNYNPVFNNAFISEKSLAEFSFDAWLRDSAIPDNTHRVCYYKGGLVARILDIDMRLKTNHTKTLDGFFRLLYDDIYKKGNTFNSAQLLNLLNNYSGFNYSTFFDKYIYGTDPVPFQEYLNKIGLELKADKEQAFLGVKLSNEIKSESNVLFVYPDSPADKLGIGRGDIILTINGIAVNHENWESLLKDIDKGSEIELTWSHNKNIRTGRIRIEEKRAGSFSIARMEDISKDQEEFIKKWMDP
ncbi:MAG: hypothetical protein A2W30_08110 [Ignavibacteria bacterium RBG_16_36_9]|nr:MAG: hypothetical protein A2W30_08110 [Ignavibacteria bacterium RBG_16_36_9]